VVQIVWKGSVFDHSGYSRACREYLLALNSINLNLKLNLLTNNWPRLELPSDHLKIFNRLIAEPNSGGKQFHIIHQTPEHWTKKPGYTAGFTYWETSKIPNNWIGKCNEMDAVFVSSQHNSDIFRKSGVNTPIYKIRPCLSPSILQQSIVQIPTYLPQQPSFRFLSIFEWIERKGYDLLLKAYFEEFSSKEDVVLIIKSHNAFIQEKVKEESLKYKDPGRVFIDIAIRNDFEMAGLYKNCSAFVHASRGEGIGYPLLEAGAFGLPVIATGWGGHMDFLNQNNSYLIPYQLVPVNPQPYYHGYKPDQSWAEASIGELKRLMRHVYTNYQEAKQKASRLKAYVHEHHTFEKAATDLVSAITQITKEDLKALKEKSPNKMELRFMNKLCQIYKKNDHDFVRGMYRELMHREPTAQELEQSKIRLSSGQSKQDIIISVIQSEECVNYFNLPYSRTAYSNPTLQEMIRSIFKTDMRVFVHQLYQEMLLREPDTAGIEGFINFLRNGGSRITVIVSFLSSPECTSILSSL
jgi:glycosyltransferase involved in cell wall biosynthesis